eukprot:CAMPEP_0206844286 /NCGR_PEP_ID=MMETSP0975-20121206/23897_1 /ASSEMBLY_ACC=CAM_ASM_000399 /TAXON_ID=483370 /ORGANISM="non described non described, Strain CCMP2097" /LENGTH=45 /DNA_ID= /DNA_START= /DNA_END= /DNA_ORIENTATION=
MGTLVIAKIVAGASTNAMAMQAPAGTPAAQGRNPKRMAKTPVTKQ